jgi:branched-chain amino acid transport system permease protein
VTAATSTLPGTAGRTFVAWIPRALVLAFVALIVLAAPFLTDPVDSTRFSEAVAFAVIGLSLNVLLGYVGSISLGHAAFVGVGSFASAYMVSQQGQPFAVGVIVAAIIGGLQAGLLGVLSLRVTGLYFALITLAYGAMAQDTLFGIDSLTGGGAGQEAPNPFGPSAFRAYYYLSLAILGGVLFVDWSLMRSKAGRALLALRENPRVAASLGINVKVYTLLGFVVSGVFAGIGGALFAHGVGQANSQVYSFNLTLIFVIMTVVGGLRNRAGVVVGSMLFALITYIIEKVPGLAGRFEHANSTIPVLVVLVCGGVLVADAARGRVGQRQRLAVNAACGVLVLLSLAVVGPGNVPFVETHLRELPALTPEIGRLVLGPVLLLVVLTRLPGGIGQLITPFSRWIGGHDFDWSSGRVEEVQVNDVRA